MVSYSRTDMKNPVRPAPLPPASNRNVGLHRSTSALDDWGDSNDPFAKVTLTHRPSSAQFGQPTREKKKPPPRPPPPKIAQKNQRKVPTRPSSLLSGLFTRSTSRSSSSQQTISSQQKNVVKKDTHAPVPTASLIDLHSPSCSPTPTTRSSSDGLSVNSFGSDGSVSTNGQTPGGGSSSFFESGFEDDFDFFGGLSSSSSFGTPLSEQKDPWSVTPQDPFSPPRQQTTSNAPAQKQISFNASMSSAPTQRQTGNSTFFTQTNTVKTSSFTSMPTIIRAKPGRPPTLPKLNEAPSDQNSGISLFPVAASRSISSHHTSAHVDSKYDIDDDSGKWSPPMPSIPPPPPPPEALYDKDPEPEGPLPELPPRPSHIQEEDTQQPYGIALYDYSATHPDDLSFCENDTILLLNQVNEEWFYGQKGHSQGMFPANFIKVVVPLNDTRGKSRKPERSPARIVKALYSFTPETWDDLEFQEGASIYVTSRINSDWLYGECDGKSGQFPASFVDHIPPNLPQRTN